jgi:putative ABC transport system permease protein
MQTIWQDLRFAARALIKRPAFAAISVFVLALGIGANTSIFSVVQTLVLNPLPYPEPASLVAVCQIDNSPPSRDRLATLWSYPKLEMLSHTSQTLAGVAAYASRSATVMGAQNAEQVTGEMVTANYFSLLGVSPLFGREFTEEEDQVGTSAVVILSHELWQKSFGGDANVIEKTIEMNSVRKTVIGIMPPGFRGQYGTAMYWMPLKSAVRPDNPSMLTSPNIAWFEILARMKAGVSREQANSEMQVIRAQMDQRWPQPRSRADRMGELALVPLAERKVDPAISRASLVLFAAVGFVLLIACANIANLFLTRGAARRKEIAIRLALGATRLRIVGLLISESLMIATAGGMGGLLLAMWGTELLNKYKPTAAGSVFWASYARTLDFFSIRLGVEVMLFNFAVALVTGLLFGLMPAIQASREDVAEALKGGSARSSYAFGRKVSLGSLLVMIEVSLALLLLSGAGLMTRSLGKLQSVSLGCDPKNVLTFAVSGQKADKQFRRELHDRIAGLPGVVSVAEASVAPLGGAAIIQDMKIKGRTEVDATQNRSVSVQSVSSGYFSTLGIPIIRGRGFTDADRAGGPRVAIINETAARRFWPDSDPIGQRVIFDISGVEEAEIVGVAGDVRYLGIEEPFGADIYNPAAQADFAFTYVVRTLQNPLSLVSAVRHEVHELNSGVPLTRVQTLEERVRDATSRSRFTGILLSLFAGLALILAALGVYGVIAYVVTERTREIGIRMAVGAQRVDILRLVMKRGLAVIMTGVGIGLLASLALTRLMSSLLYGLSATDPITFAAVSGVVIAAGLVACIIPARRATRVDPVEALRSE